MVKSPTQEGLGPDGLAAKFYQTFKEELVLVPLLLPTALGGKLPNLPVKPGYTGTKTR